MYFFSLSIFLQSWAVAQKFSHASYIDFFFGIHSSSLLSSPNYCKCLKLLPMAVRTEEEGGRRLSFEDFAVSFSVQSQL